VGEEVLRESKQKPLKAVAILGSLAAFATAVATNPDETSYRDIILDYSLKVTRPSIGLIDLDDGVRSDIVDNTITGKNLVMLYRKTL
jgi:hypothetical protein